MNKTKHNSRIRSTELLIHIIGWGFVLAFPLLLVSREGYNERWLFHAIPMIFMQISFLIIFYINYLFLIPQYVFNGKISKYIILNVILIIVSLVGLHFIQEYFMYKTVQLEIYKPKRVGPPKWIFTIRDAFTMVLTIGLSMAIRMSKKWVQTESARQESEKNRIEAELKNLRSQINPHFLLNTLNNIYALIAFDSDKAQSAVQELSKLLRYVLYDNQQNMVSLSKEAEFIRNYIELMKIRLADNVILKTDINITKDNNTMISPLIFISLIENSFKHGISPTQESHILIELSENNGIVKCKTINSYYPKNRNDKSGSGIGLGQVKKRLELLYPKQYKWEYGVINNEYISTLIINTRNNDTKLYNN